MLRTPAPFRSLAAALGLAGLVAVSLSALPALSDRVRLSEALIDVPHARLDPLLDHAHTGRWLQNDLIAAAADRDVPQRLGRRVIADGIVITQTRGNDQVDLVARYVMSASDTVYWRCHVRATDSGTPVAPLSVPAICRE